MSVLNFMKLDHKQQYARKGCKNKYIEKSVEA